MVKDPHAKTYTAVLALEGSTFSLLETSVRGARVDAWGSLLAQLCSENAVISRLQILERTVPDSGDALHRDWARRGIHDDSFQAANYEQLLAAVDGSTQAHECFLAVTVDARRAGSRDPPGRRRRPGCGRGGAPGDRQDRRRPEAAPASGWRAGARPGCSGRSSAPPTTRPPGR